jgi:hypothetical protein
VKRQELSLVTSSIDPETGLIAVNIIIDGHQEVRLVTKRATVASAIRSLAESLAREQPAAG